MKFPPSCLKKYFWDVELRSLDARKHPQFMIERILEYGDEEAIRWLKENFSKRRIKNTICQSRILSKKSAIFWSKILSVDRRKILCLRGQFRKQHRKIWPY